MPNLEAALWRYGSARHGKDNLLNVSREDIMASPINANAVLCVKGEIHNVLTVLRLNSRWASRERFSREVPLQAESPLSRAFKGLHSHLEEVDDLANVDTVR